MDPATDKRTSQPLRNLSLWTDVHTNGNMGTQSSIIRDAGLIFGFGQNIASLYQVSPRLVYNAGSLSFGFEAEYTAATFGSSFEAHAVPADTHTTGTLRILFSTYFYF